MTGLIDASSVSGPVESARELVMVHGWNATAYQIVNPGITLWFAKSRDAVVGYVDRGHTRVQRWVTGVDDPAGVVARGAHGDAMDAPPTATLLTPRAILR